MAALHYNIMILLCTFILLVAQVRAQCSGSTSVFDITVKKGLCTIAPSARVVLDSHLDIGDSDNDKSGYLTVGRNAGLGANFITINSGSITLSPVASLVVNWSLTLTDGQVFLGSKAIMAMSDSSVQCEQSQIILRNEATYYMGETAYLVMKNSTLYINEKAKLNQTDVNLSLKKNSSLILNKNSTLNLSKAVVDLKTYSNIILQPNTVLSLSNQLTSRLNANFLYLTNATMIFYPGSILDISAASEGHGIRLTNGIITMQPNANISILGEKILMITQFSLTLGARAKLIINDGARLEEGSLVMGDGSTVITPKFDKISFLEAPLIVDGGTIKVESGGSFTFREGCSIVQPITVASNEAKQACDYPKSAVQCLGGFEC